MVDFDDLLRLCSHLHRDRPAFAAAQRWRFQHLFVDEFQDVNPLQLRLLDAWRGDRCDLCVVGDPHQAIYGWNGADAGFLRASGGCTRRPRSSPSRATTGRPPRSWPPPPTCWAGPGPGDAPGRHPGRARRSGSSATPASTTRPRPSPGRCATGGPAPPGRPRPCSSAPTPRSPSSPTPCAGPGSPTACGGRTACSTARRCGPPRPAAPRASPLSACLPDLGALARGRRATAADDLAVVVQLAHDHLRLDPTAAAAGFASWLVATLRPSPATPGDAVTVATFHAAKGLEWPTVHLAGWRTGWSRSPTPAPTPSGPRRPGCCTWP